MGVRGRAASVVAAVNWASNLLVSMTFLTITGVIVPMMFLHFHHITVGLALSNLINMRQVKHRYKRVGAH